MLKIVVGLVLLVAFGIAIEEYLLPIFKHITVEQLKTLEISDIMKMFEAAIIIIILGGFIMQEIWRSLPKVLHIEQSHEREGARWRDLLFAFAAAFGSAMLFMALFTVRHN